MFDVFYIGENTKLKEALPFATPVTTNDDVAPRTKMYWLVEPNIEVTDLSVFEYRPPDHDQAYEHVWKWNSKNYGGIKLVPRIKSRGTKEINRIVCRKNFDILHTPTPADYFDLHPYATHVWCVDSEYKLGKDINWAPDNFEPNFIHSFHLRGQLEHKYPEREGGIKLYPRNWRTAQIKYHSFLDAGIEYPVLRVNDVDDYAQRDKFRDEYVWLIDEEHSINTDTLDWVPNPFERAYVHSFRMPYQLTEKYPQAMGGIRLVPRDWASAELKIHPGCPIKDEKYDVFYISSDEFNEESYNELAQRSKSEWFWVVDREYDFNGELLFVPAAHEHDYIHVFKIPGMLEERYPLNITQPWDNRCGGVRLVNKNFDMTKHKYQANIVPVRYDIFYTDNIKQFETYARKSTTKMFWLIDKEYQLRNDFKVVVPKHEQQYMLNYQISNQLRHKYPDKEGGIFLIPKSFNDATQIKYKGSLQSEFKRYPVIRVNDINDLSKVTEDCWLVDKEYQISTDIDWAPNTFERCSIHTFHVPGQLQHKYPEEMGGVRWVPLDWDGNYVIHSDSVTTNLVYPVLRVDNVEDLSVVKQDCWLIDRGYEINEKITWNPPYFQRKSIHVFHMANQLKDKYPLEMGGMRWVPVDWNGEYVIHKEYLNVEKQYPLYFAEDPTVPPDTYEDCWVADSLYRIKSPINWLPTDYDRDKIHVFHVYGQLTGKYTESMGGLYWYPANRTDAQLKVQDKPLLLTASGYPVYFVDNPADFSTVTEDCWLVDSEYVLNENITIIPWQNETEKQMVHVYHVRGQLEHKYPEEMGGVYWVPANWKNAKIKIHDVTPFGDNLKFDVYPDEETGRRKATTGWFWVVDPNVELLPDFKLDYVPKVWDAGKAHVWQKLNPVTGRQYDYAGVMLCPKVPQAKGRPKYIREAACTQKEFPILHLDPVRDIIEQLTHIDNAIENSMYWVMDPFTQVNPDFKFDYYPTQWDQQNVHVFTDEDGKYRNIRLYPKGTFAKSYTVEDIANNSFEKLKQINTVGSLRPRWPVVHLKDVTKAELVNALQESVNQGIPFLWTVDPDVSVDTSVLDAGYLPELTDIHKVHVWQRQNPHTGKTHSYGGLRLWPTARDYSDITTDGLRLNKIKNIQYVKEIGSTYKPYDIVFLSYKEEGATSAYKRLTARFPATWVKDVAGIFEAHKAAAQSVNSKMFWVVDADADILDTFEFGYIPDVYDQEVVHVWSSQNPVTGQQYGYGGVKLFNREQVINATSWGLDFTTGLSTRFKAMPEVSCVTRFNTDAYSTWRSAFRECVKLALKDDAESVERLDGWLHPVPDAFFRHDAKRGAEEGRAYALANRNDIEALARINDYEWLRNRYNQQ